MRLPYFFGLTVSLLIAGGLSAQEAERWQETAYGISLVPPADAKLIEQPSDGSAAAWVHAEDYLIRFKVVHSDQPVNIDAAAILTQVQMLFSEAEANQIFLEQQRIGDRPGVLSYYQIYGGQPVLPGKRGGQPVERAGDFFHGLAMFMIDPRTVAVLTLDQPGDVADLTNAEREALPARQVFEQVVKSVQVPLPMELDERRAAQIAAGVAWWQSFSRTQVAEAIPDEQWYRLIEDGRDAGYAWVRSTDDPGRLKEAGIDGPGLLVQADTRHVIGPTAVDVQIRMFSSADGEVEVWSNKTTARPSESRWSGERLTGPAKDAGDERTWVESGMRGPRVLGEGERRGGGRSGSAYVAPQRVINAITVTFEQPPNSDTVREVQRHERFSERSPVHRTRLQRQMGLKPRSEIAGSVESMQWQTPKEGYLSQAELVAVPRLLVESARRGQDVPEVLAFYGYDANTGRLGLRRIRITSDGSGGWKVYDRPGSRRGEIVTQYDAGGEMMQRVFPSGLVMEPTTADQLKVLWELD